MATAPLARQTQPSSMCPTAKSVFIHGAGCQRGLETPYFQMSGDVFTDPLYTTPCTSGLEPGHKIQQSIFGGVTISNNPFIKVK